MKTKDSEWRYPEGEKKALVGKDGIVSQEKVLVAAMQRRSQWDHVIIMHTGFK